MKTKKQYTLLIIASKTKKQHALLIIASICRSRREKEPQHNFLPALLNIDELLLIEDITTLASCYHEVEKKASSSS